MIAPRNDSLYRVGYFQKLVDRNCDPNVIETCQDEARLKPIQLLFQILGIPMSKILFTPVTRFDFQEAMTDFHANMAFMPIGNNTLVLPMSFNPLVAVFAPLRLMPKVSDHDYVYSPFTPEIWLAFGIVWLISFLPMTRFQLNNLAIVACFASLQALYAAVLKGNRSSFYRESIPFSDRGRMREALIEKTAGAILETDHNYAFGILRHILREGIPRSGTVKYYKIAESNLLLSLEHLVYFQQTTVRNWFCFRPQEYAGQCGFPEIQVEGIPQRYFGFLLPKHSPWVRVISPLMPILSVVERKMTMRRNRLNAISCRRRFPDKYELSSNMVNNVSLISIFDGITTLISPAGILAALTALIELVHGYKLFRTG